MDNCGAHLGTLEAGLGFLLLKFLPSRFSIASFSAISADKTAPARPRTSTYIIIHSTCVSMYLSAFIYIILFFEGAFICTDLYFLRSLPTAGTCGALTTVWKSSHNSFVNCFLSRGALVDLASFRVMRPVVRQRPPVQHLLCQCSRRRLTVCVMRTREQNLCSGASIMSIQQSWNDVMFCKSQVSFDVLHSSLRSSLFNQCLKPTELYLVVKGT